MLLLEWFNGHIQLHHWYWPWSIFKDFELLYLAGGLSDKGLNDAGNDCDLANFYLLWYVRVINTQMSVRPEYNLSGVSYCLWKLMVEIRKELLSTGLSF